MKKLQTIITLACILAGLQAASADVLLIVNGSKEAYTFDTNTKQIQPIAFDVLYVDGDAVPAPPGGPDDRPTPPADSIRSKVAGWAAGVDDATGARWFESVFGLLAEQIKKGTIPADADSVDQALTMFLDKALDTYPGDREKKAAWRAVREKIVADLGQHLVKNGGQLTGQQWGDYFQSVADGFEDAAAGQALPPFLQPFIDALLGLLLQWLLKMFGG